MTLTVDGAPGGVRVTVWDKRLAHAVVMSPTEAVEFAGAVLHQTVNLMKMLETDQPFEGG